MCFSAKASFIASGALIASSVYTIAKTKSTHQSHFLLLAMLPLLFGIQQLSEGFIWVFLGQNPDLDYFLSCIFLFFAFFLWPVYVPLALALFEEERRLYLYPLAFGGLIFGIILYGSTFIYPSTFHLHLCDRSVCYQINHPLFNHWGILFYFVFTLAPFIFVKSNLLRILGALFTLSAIFTGIFFKYAFTSVWCFFSAALSIFIAYLAYKLDVKTT